MRYGYRLVLERCNCEAPTHIGGIEIVDPGSKLKTLDVAVEAAPEHQRRLQRDGHVLALIGGNQDGLHANDPPSSLAEPMRLRALREADPRRSTWQVPARLPPGSPQ